MRDRFAELCHAIGETVEVGLEYASSIPGDGDIAGSLRDAFETRRSTDARRGLTHAGPHRDDLSITLNGRDLRTFGSAGQQRTAAIALRMLEALTFTVRSGRAPVFLLDDPFAELDLRRAHRILELLTRQGRDQQIILAVPRDADIPAELTSLQRWRVVAGTVALES
jgi:DNA replication and repair protein RecF